MEDQRKRPVGARIAAAALSGFKAALRTIFYLLRIVLPVTLAVALLDWFGVLSWVARLMSPAMGLVGLPGEAALVFISSVFLNIYSAIAVAFSMSLDMRAATILAIMCLTAHNLIVQTAVMKKTGSSSSKMVFLRLGTAFVAAYVFNLLLPAAFAALPFSSAGSGIRPSFLNMLIAWGVSAAMLALKIVLIVIGVMIVQRILEEFKAMDFLSRLFAPIMKLFGLPREASFLWIVINVVGYAYGAGIIEEQVDAGWMKPRDADLFNHHAGICHSLLEDTTLFLAVGIPFFWITLPRFLLALLVVWLERARRRFSRRTFRIGTV
jgi:spore maturation protein SpmB